MRLTRLWIGIVLWLAASAASWAQQSWVQIEARPTLSEAEERARAYANAFPNVAGFAMSTGWYAIALGPYTDTEAAVQLQLLRGERLIPSDSYVSDGGRFGRQFWPVGGAVTAPAPASGPVVSVETPQAQTPAVTLPAVLPDETPAEARRSEALLTGDDRKELQEALQWYGHYAGAIDGAFGPGTRRSMAEWQTAEGLEPTGVLTTAQRGRLLSGYEGERDAIGFQAVAEDEAGIEITLPLSLVAFDRYQPPFVQYKEKDGSGYRALLISQPGDQTTLSGLYDLMQTLEIVPLEGERQLGRNSFVLTGANDRIGSYTEVALKGGFVKGFTLVWPMADAARAEKVLAAMKSGFRPVGDHALDDSLGQPMAVSRADLVAGLAVRRPLMSRSGFYVDATGRVATTTEVLKGCGRLTIDGGIAMTVAAQDDVNGVAILMPDTALAPLGVAQLKASATGVGGEIAVAGYSYPDTLTEPVVTFGTLADTKDLDGNTARERLALKALEGDAGGPVLDATGRVIGMLLPKVSDGGRILPEDVSFAADSAVIRSAMGPAETTGATAGEAETTTPAPGAMAAEDLARLGRDMTVQVSCWE
ncbi:trypsin-like peptidase [Defluviimonas denitrificans]|jgi:peptidoglycan hydrolase-like protein with peptidoglycan-binding domain|uniref:Trypsin-like peptidase n=1 Tax=Albidovulum denitrificans TaxID=404881 RepID=A0A2S8SE00_9RHOB|nr:serine protease [Defluviimonas denitrificans]PQV58979.1 trypsin-like peptidase [Defluviimonas denitrificans]